MTSEDAPQSQSEPAYLSLFCSRGADGWRVHTITRWLPAYLRQYFDRGQAYPVQLDLADLDRQMKAAPFEYEKRASTLGGMELTAHGEATIVLSDWLASMFASGVRPQTGVSREGAR